MNILKFMMRSFLLYTLCLLFSLQAYAQTGSVRGNVFDKVTGEPIMYGNVVIEGTTLGTTTDLDGFFSISNIPAGEHILVASYVGYDNTEQTVRVRGNGIEYVQVYITEGVQLETVNVSAEREQARTTVKISKVTVTPKQIKSLPSTGGEADIAQYLPVLPGVIFTGDQGGQLYIRGGSPIQNKILLDGMTIYNPFHSIGFFSVFETEILRNVDVLTGGYDASYGGRISAIVDIKTREGNKKRYGGVASVNPFQGKLLLEGPIKKLKDEGGGSSSFIFTAKHSYINETSKSLYNYAAVDTASIPFAIDPDTLGLPYSFTDVYGKLSFMSGNGSKVNLFGFNFQDRVDFPGFADLGWTNYGGGASLKLIPPTSDFIIGANINFSQYDIGIDMLDDNDNRSSSINSYGATLDFSYFGNNSELKYGLDFNGFSTNFQFINPANVTFKQEDFTTEVALFAKYKHKIKNFIIEPGFRLQYYASQSKVVPEPRLGMKYNITDFLRVKFAGGLFSQNLISTVSEQDVVNLFVGFLSGPERDFFKPNSTEEVDHKLQRAFHGIGGIEIDVTKQLELNVEPYYKGFTQLIYLNRQKLEASDPEFVTETGEAYGIDFSVKYDNKSTSLWATYSLGYVNRDDGLQVYPTIFDRRHNVNFLLSHAFGPRDLWEASVRWNMGSGFPFTQTQGFYNFENFAEESETNIGSQNGELGVILSETRNGGRLPYYHRMDLSLKKTFEFTKNLRLESILSFTNAYNRENIFYYDRKTNSRVNQLPILPSLGLIFHF